MTNKIYDENTRLYYKQQGDYLIPCLSLPNDTTKPIGIWGQLHLRYIKQQKRVFYANLLATGKLNSYLSAVEEQADKMFTLLVKHLAENENITEKLKADNPMMYNHRARTGHWEGKRPIDPEIGLFPHDHYDCSTYYLTKYKSNKKCFGHYINTNSLRTVILDAIKITSKYAIENRDEFIAKMREASQIQQADQIKELKKQLEKNKKRYSKLDNIIKKLYERFASDKISKKRFDTLSEEYEAEQTELEKIIDDMQSQVDNFEEDTDRANQFLELSEKYTNFDKLTTPMINEFIDKIYVHAPDKSKGERIQEIEIYMNFIGKSDVPMSEPVPEELSETEKVRIRRQKQREANKRYREKQKRLKLEAQQKAN